MNYNKFTASGLEKMLLACKKQRLLSGQIKYCIMFLFMLVILFGTSCKKAFLDVVPDNVATIDNAFASKIEAEKYLFTCYSYLPHQGNFGFNPGLMAGDEFWAAYPVNSFYNQIWEIGRGNQNTVDPYCNYMEGNLGGTPNFKAIRDCNVFLENISDISKVRDLDPDTRTRWIGEVQFLKAFYHFIMFRAYGPIPVIDKNLPISASIEQMQVKRQSVDSVVNYISNLLDVAATHLPLTITNQVSELGRITSPIALSLKARLLTTAASPLFNGNPDYNSFKNKDGGALFNSTPSLTKWQRAANACKAAIDLCNKASIKLYVFPVQANHLSDTTMTQMSIRNATSEPWNSELIWGLTVNDNIDVAMQRSAAGRFDPANASNLGGTIQTGPTLKMAKLFYTQNGVPINEDKTLDFSNITKLRTGTHVERFNLIENYETARLNFDREPRYYADLGFDGCVWYMANSPSLSDENTWTLQSRQGQYGATAPPPLPGLFAKKLLNWHFEWSSTTFQSYPWPEMRLADLYLLYAEALNEAQGPVADVYTYVNIVRARAGLRSVQTSWTNFSNNPSKYTTKEGMRSIIQQERSIELCFEGQRYWDLLRWKTAATELNGNITGWDTKQSDPNLYYREITLFSQQFRIPRDYLWPIKDQDLLVNSNLVQNPNW
ncbi:RagB/SusD family nutrient uptake outer membrane protein [Pedobacter nutrimenti]|uniref:RagB/SusD family nutrient uptake outer membrane protein n=1 Tax=Pedobacter nutrimenti TaxID=1241337 RepID=UPI00292F3027|nr:RagB/SusD family nutrient uptake outer membrane protein [Pedobacter nutrimenti]